MHTEKLEQNLSRNKNNHSNVKTENRAVDSHFSYGKHKDLNKKNKFPRKYGCVREIWIGVREMSENFVMLSLYEPCL